MDQKKDMSGPSVPSNQKFFDWATDALSEREPWVQKLGRYELQRFCLDRSKVNNNPWPKASNIRYPLSDMIISQKKPFFRKVIFSGDELAHFRGMDSRLVRFNAHAAGYFDYHLKELTNFNEQIQYAADQDLQDGETWMKTTWDIDKSCVYFEKVDNLFVITPSNTQNPDDAPWLIHILQKSKRWIRKQFKDVPDIEKLIEKASNTESSEQQPTDRERSRYDRQGINRSYKGGAIVLWEIHYKDDQGNRRMRTVSPDLPEFNLGDDRGYPYDYGDVEGGADQYMLQHGRLEYTDPSIHSSRGTPELVQEGEHSLSAMWRAKHNSMTLYNAPMLYAPQGTNGGTQNLSFVPGTMAPYPIEKIDLGQPPISWDIEMRNTREIFERRAMIPDFGIGSANTQGESRTKFEVQQISNLQGLTTDLETSNWLAFVRRVYKQAWSLMVQFYLQGDNETMEYFVNGEASEIPKEAFSHRYLIHPAGSVDAVNKEFMVQRAVKLWELAQGNPFANGKAIWQNVIERLEPGRVEDFVVDPQQRQQQAVEKAASDLSIMIGTGFPIVAKPGEDYFTQAVTAVQYLMKAQESGQALTQDTVLKITQYIASQREALKQTDKNKYAELSQALDQLDQQAAQQQAMIMKQKAMQQGLLPQMSPTAAPQAPMPPQPQQMVA